MTSNSSRVKTYSDKRYLHTTMVRHLGTTVALAMDDSRRIFYSVLDLDRTNRTDSGPETAYAVDLDVEHWAQDPVELRFPGEIARAGFAVVGATPLPRVKQGARAEATADEVLGADEIDGFLSSTARLSAQVPFQAVSDGRHLYIFRQAVGAAHEDALYRLKGGGCSAVADRTDYLHGADGDERVQVASDALLCDRFLLAGGQLKPVMEVRYRRSRHRTLPDSAKDSLGTRDMDGNEFYEPTLELGFAGRITQGRFTTLLLPTAVQEVRRWQFFVHNDRTGRIDGFNVEQGKDGLFNTQGTRFYTSPDPQYRSSVFERSPGQCPFTKADLVPVATDEGFAETALDFDGTGAYVKVEGGADSPLGSGPYTIEAWVAPRAVNGTVLSTGSAASGITLRIDGDGLLRLGHGGGTQAADGAEGEAEGAAEAREETADAPPEAVSADAVPLDGYTHIAAVYSGTKAVLYVDGVPGEETELPVVEGAGPVLIGAGPDADAQPGSFFTGAIDEIRLWTRPRGAEELLRDRSYRLIGDESGLSGYYRFDAGAGTTLYDQTDSAAHGALLGDPRWITSEAPIGDHPGVRRESFSVPTRTVGSGLASVLYYQQEEAVSGHSAEPKPLKRHARVLLTWVAGPQEGADDSSGQAATSEDAGATTADGSLAVLDLAVARDGRLAQLPDAVSLPTIGETVQAVDPEAIAALGQSIEDLKAELAQAQKSLVDVKQLPALEKERRTKAARVKSLGDQMTPGAPIQGKRYFVRYPASDQEESDAKQSLSLVAKVPHGADSAEVTFVAGAVDETADWIFEFFDRSTSRTMYGGHVNARCRLVHVQSKMLLAVTEGQQLVVRPRKGDEAEIFDYTWTVVSDPHQSYRRYGTLSKGSSFLLVESGKPTLKVVSSEAPLSQFRPAWQGGAQVVKLRAEAKAELTALDRRIKDLKHQQSISAQTRQRITGIETDLAAKQEELGHVTGGLKGRSALSLAMPQLGRDRLGLGWSGGLLTFARTRTAPFLLDSGTGHLGLYFQDDEGHFTAAYYDTSVARSAKALAVGEECSILLTARDPGTDLKQVTAEVSAGDHPDRCVVTLRESDGGTTADEEVWPMLPRRADQLVEILNGVIHEPVVIGEATYAQDGVLTLTAPAGLPVPAGSLLDVDGEVLVVQEAAEATATGITLAPGDDVAWVTPGSPVRLISYSPHLVRHSRPGATATYGSRLVTANLVGAPADVPDGSATDLTDARPTRWWGDIPGRALSFTANSRPPALPTERHDAVRAADDLTLEAWVQPKAGDTGDAEDCVRLVHANVPESQYSLALGKPGDGGARPLVAAVGNRWVTSRTAVPDGRWTHVAAAFEQSWALRLGGKASLEVAHTDALNLTRDLTVEVFLQADALGSVQGLVSKGRIADGRGQHVPYQLALDAEGHLVLATEAANGDVFRFTSEKTITAGSFHRVAVVRKPGQTMEEKPGKKEFTVTDAAGNPTTHTVPVIESILMHEWFDYRFYIDGEDAGSFRHNGAAPLGSTGPLDIGCGWQGAAPQHFTGLISEVRIWNTARDETQIAGPVTAREQGLAAHWRFEENEGNTARDETDAHPARLHGATWAKNPDPRGSVFRLYLDGSPVPCDALAADALPDDGEYGDQQFALAGRTDGGTAQELYTGTLEEVRVWRTARTEEQILDNLFTRLRGEKEELLAYYPFDDDSTEESAQAVLDSGLRGCDLLLPTDEAARPTPLLSTAPISGDTAEVRPAFSKVSTRYSQTITGVPAASEYADLQYDARGGTRGVLKRCYGFVSDGAWQLVTGYKIGNLLTEWVSQIQFAPQIIGFIEGAPPVPSENMVATKNPKHFSYLNASSVEFVQADEVVNTLSSTQDRGVDTAFGISLSKEVDVNTLMIMAPLGMGVAKPAAQGGVSLYGGGNLEIHNGWGDETEVSQGQNTARSTSVGLSGGWEDSNPDNQLNSHDGRRFVPSNTGYALVQSETADVFALRLAHNHALVSYRVLPNPDIPRDWNILPFPINPLYTKQGTLDGTVGVDGNGERVFDTDYQGAPAYGEHSYFKPREAYALKRRITEEQQRLQAHYDTVSTETHAADPTADRARKLLGDFIGPVRKPERGTPRTTETARGFSRRNIANTYAWSADGGFFAETTEATDVVTEVTSGSFDISGSLSFSASGGVKIFGVGATLQVDVSAGGALHRTRARTREATRSFSLNVVCDPPGDMQGYDKDANPVFEDDGTPVTVPGRVDAYRFMTFYLDADKDNFEDFYAKVVDPKWLQGSNDPNAAALRQARQSEKKPPCWRVMHRVTFISRTLSETVPDSAPAVEKAMRAENIDSNYELIRKLEPYIKDRATSYRELARAVRDTLARQFPGLVPHTEQIIGYLSVYYALGE
ncbi:LamG-like jellyroll fold domain-containing protein [Streptomyces sp. x-80]|uniref:LamG-like jellyroll fold domain-containing protein n=1 Tax=Streptomyces sp. x-80 TaxID=2789282 RepID=UPI00397FD978